jgi:Spy/CpxP family protein refolding chaperone
MKILSNVIGVILVVTVVNFYPSACYAQPAAEEIEQQINQTLQDKLGLTEAQLEQIQAEQEEQIQKRRDLSRQEALKRDALRLELEKADSDPRKVDALVNELNAVREQVIKLRVESVKSLKSILSEEQYQKVVEIQKEAQMDKEEKRKVIEKKWEKWQEKKKEKKSFLKKWFYYYFDRKDD